MPKILKGEGEYPICPFCDEPVISPANLKEHLSCRALDSSAKAIELDTTDITFPTP